MLAAIILTVITATTRMIHFHDIMYLRIKKLWNITTF